MSEKYALPSFLENVVTQAIYVRWLGRKAAAHLKRDRKRGNKTAVGEAYKMEIHRAVLHSLGHDQYTGETLDWSLISRYKNAESKEGRRHYKAQFARLPTVDHVGDGLGSPSFRICAWRTNDAKNDLTHDEFVDLCRRVVAHFDRV